MEAVPVTSQDTCTLLYRHPLRFYARTLLVGASITVGIHGHLDPIGASGLGGRATADPDLLHAIDGRLCILRNRRCEEVADI